MSRLLKRNLDSLKPVTGDKEIPLWVQEAYTDFREMLCHTKDPFPCYFGVIAEEEGCLQYTYLEDNEITRPAELVVTLFKYLDTYRSIKGRSALIVFAGREKPNACLEDYKSDFWAILQFLHNNDPAPWPVEIPTDPKMPHWEFCFGGEPIFITGHSPLHLRRRSRYSSKGLLLIIQTRANLQGLVGHGNSAEKIRCRIRDAVRKYDSTEPSPNLGIYGDPLVSEWKQYWLADLNEFISENCPLHIQQQMPGEDK